MRKTLIIGIASVAVIGLVGAGVARGVSDGKHARRFMAFRIDTMLEDINATGQQRAQIKQVAETLFNDGMQLRQATEQAHRQLLDQWQSEQMDSTKVHALVNQRIDELRGFADKAVDDLVKVHDILTPEQRAQLATEFKKHHHRGE